MKEQQEKARFFAQYFGQHVQFYNGSETHFDVNSATFSIDLENSFLLLKSLSSISDEDAIEVAKIYGWEETTEQESFLEFGKYVLGLHTQDVKMYLYLQSIGYALPFMQYSVDQLIEMGWIKLQDSK